MNAFDPEGGGQTGPDTFAWPCGCTVVSRPAFRDMIVVPCDAPGHDDALDALTAEIAAKLGKQFNRVYPGTN